jgi:multiple antibiotic resistance protein
MTVVTAALLLFMVMDPFGNVPVFVSVLKNVPPERRRAVLVRELFIALAVLMAFLLGGPAVMQVLNISETSLRIAGGIILFMIASKMVFGQSGELWGNDGTAADGSFH